MTTMLPSESSRHSRPRQLPLSRGRHRLTLDESVCNSVIAKLQRLDRLSLYACSETFACSGHGSLGMYCKCMLHQSSSTLWTYGHAAFAALLNLGCVVVPIAQQTCLKGCTSFSLASGIEVSDATDWIVIRHARGLY